MSFICKILLLKMKANNYHGTFFPTLENTPRLRVALKDVSQPEFADALTQQLGKCRSLQAEAAKDDLREMVRQVIREELRAV